MSIVSVICVSYLSYGDLFYGEMLRNFATLRYKISHFSVFFKHRFCAK